MKPYFLMILLVFIIALCSSCDKPINDGCYSSELEESHSGFCFTDCPGVCGCDGVTYCNECTANSHGIMEVTNGPCE